MRKWKVIKRITGILLILFLGLQVYLMAGCIMDKYPQPMLGIEARWWFDQYVVRFMFSMMYLGLPLLACIMLFIIAMKKIRKGK